MERKTQKVLGYDVDNITFDNAVEKVMQRIQSWKESMSMEKWGKNFKDSLLM